jgi:DNA modification methylase
MTIADKKITKDILLNWKANTAHSEWSLHQLSPYIGKLKSSVAHSLIKNYTKEGDIIYDPFCGAGTIPLEAWALNRSVIANDLNYYAFVLTNAKLNPPKTLSGVLKKIDSYNLQIDTLKSNVDLRKVPQWVRAFFHRETLRETIAWCEVLRKNNEYFILSCLLGILHHQRPGFLSYPSSHSVPYLRVNKFPQNKFPKLYEYRNVSERLKRKAERAFKRTPELNYKTKRYSYYNDATSFVPQVPIDVIISSPPYMRQLDYARDNRLRLWFLGIQEYKNLDTIISPTETDFIKSMIKCLTTWHKALKPGGLCILILGDAQSKLYEMRLPDMISKIAIEELGKYKLEMKFQSIIPERRRVRKNCKGSERETVIVFKKII